VGGSRSPRPRWSACDQVDRQLAVAFDAGHLAGGCDELVVAGGGGAVGLVPFAPRLPMSVNSPMIALPLLVASLRTMVYLFQRVLLVFVMS
jgi:hypothetical protein